MVGIVEPNADEIAGRGNAWTDANIPGDGRKSFRFDLADFRERSGSKRLRRDIGNNATQIADLPCLVEYTWLFTTLGSKPQ